MSVSDLDKLLLTRNPDDPDGDAATGGSTREYYIYPIESVDPDQTKNATSIAVPGSAPTENIFMGVSGMEGNISISFYLYDDGTDRANNSHDSDVITVTEQYRYLRDVMHAPDFSVKWELDDISGNVFDQRPVFLEAFEATPISDASPKWAPATLRLRVGQSV